MHKLPCILGVHGTLKPGEERGLTHYRERGLSWALSFWNLAPTWHESNTFWPEKYLIFEP